MICFKSQNPREIYVFFSRTGFGWCISLLLLTFSHFRVFHTIMSADGLSLESEWQKVFSSLQDSSQYSGWSQQYCHLDSLHSSKSSSPFTTPLVTATSAPIVIGITVTFMFHRFFSSLARSRYWSRVSLSFNFPLWSTRRARSTIVRFSLFLLLLLLFLTITRSGRLAKDRWSVCISKSHRILCVSFFKTDYYYYYYYCCYYSLQVFHISLSWWSFTGFWATASFQGPFRYSSRSQECSLNGLDSSSDYNFFQSSFKSFGDRSKCTNYNWYHCHPHVSHFFFLVLKQFPSICLS